MKELNLLPLAYKKRMAKNKILYKYSIYLIAFSVIALCMNLLPSYMLSQYQNKLSQLNAVIADEIYIEPVEISSRIMDLQSELSLYQNTYNNLYKPVISNVETFKQLAAQLPTGVLIETISFTNVDKSVIISGVSVNRRLVSEFVTNLINLQSVEEVEILELELMNQKSSSNTIDYRIQVFMYIPEDIS